jgi:hypothetical protein
VHIIFDSAQFIIDILETESENDCCLDLTVSGCMIQCLVECRIYTPGRQLEYLAKMFLDSDGNPSCPLPTYQSATFACSAEV